MAGESENLRLRFCGDLSVWAKELPEAARLDLNDDGKTVEMHCVSLEKRHELKLLAQRAGIDNANAIEVLLYQWLSKSAGKRDAMEWHSGYFHPSRLRKNSPGPRRSPKSGVAKCIPDGRGSRVGPLIAKSHYRWAAERSFSAAC